MIEKDVTVKKMSVIFHGGCTMFLDFIRLFLFLADLLFDAVLPVLTVKSFGLPDRPQAG